jgi:hypothetical protein
MRQPPRFSGLPPRRDRRGGCPQKLAQGDAVVGHRGRLRPGVAGRNPTLPEIPRLPPAVDSWPAYARLVVSLRQATYRQLLHHHPDVTRAARWSAESASVAKDALPFVHRILRGFILPKNTPMNPKNRRNNRSHLHRLYKQARPPLERSGCAS